MAGQPQSGRLSDADFEDLLQALSATTKGRLFLSEYLRRFRPHDTRMLLEALQRIEAAMNLLRDQLEPERLAGELRRLATTIEIAASDNPGEPNDEQQRRALLSRVRSDLMLIAGNLSSAETPEETGRIRAFEPSYETDDTDEAAVLADDLAFIDDR